MSVPIGKITSIQVQKKRRDRVAVFIEGEFGFGIHQDVLLATGIAVGDELSESQIDSIKRLEARRNAKEKAVRLLSYRARSSKEIFTRLKQSGFDQPDIEWVLQELTRLGLVDDAEFAHLFAKTRMITKPIGTFLLRQELKQRGVLEKDIQSAVAKAFNEKSEFAVARDLAVLQKKKQMKLDEQKARQRVADFLLRRGFHWDLVNEILEHWKELSDDEG
ncbi:MAG: hypothetical protein EHM72_12690 [Calditrichaeota bacterium]|nr:MAG: hypothetical protein EHM72_12690 [Calditrichota bacterium]